MRERYGQLDLHESAERSARPHVAAHCCNASAPESACSLHERTHVNSSRNCALASSRSHPGAAPFARRPLAPLEAARASRESRKHRLCSQRVCCACARLTGSESMMSTLAAGKCDRIASGVHTAGGL